MKNSIKRKSLSEIENEKGYQKELEAARLRVRFGITVYNAREALGITQSDLAKKAKTTQKMISKIENADLNIGIELQNRIAKVLNFSQKEWAKIFTFEMEYRYIWSACSHESEMQQIKMKNSVDLNYLTSTSNQ